MSTGFNVNGASKLFYMKMSIKLSCKSPLLQNLVNNTGSYNVLQVTLLQERVRFVSYNYRACPLVVAQVWGFEVIVWNSLGTTVSYSSSSCVGITISIPTFSSAVSNATPPLPPVSGSDVTSQFVWKQEVASVTSDLHNIHRLGGTGVITACLCSILKILKLA